MIQSPNIYKIKKGISYSDFIQEIKNNITLKGKLYVDEELALGEFDATLIVIQSENLKSEWSRFFPKKVTDKISLEYTMPSLSLIIKTKKHVFCIVGGPFFSYVISSIDKSYGLNTYSRIMNPTMDQIVAIKTRGVTGLRAGMQEQFKENFKIMDYIKFGKIPTELKIKICAETIIKHFSDFTSSRQPNLIINISNGININKKLSFVQLGKLIEKIENLKPNDFFSSYKEIQDESKISKSLKPALINKLYEERESILSSSINNFEICYPGKVEEFYSADEYKIKLKLIGSKGFTEIGITADKSEILKKIISYFKDKNLDKNLNKFKNNIHNVFIFSYKNGKTIATTKTALIYHLETEISFEKLGQLIYIDAKWFQLRNIFISEMNNRCKEILKSNKLNNSILTETWGKKTNGNRINESDYNLKYFEKENYLVLDTIVFDSIELADVIKIEKDVIYLCHIKWGFSTDLRVLYNQIITSARMLANDLKDSNTPYLTEIYKKLTTKYDEKILTKEQFIESFKTKKKVFVMSFTGHLVGHDVVTNIEDYTSNIAKISLIQCFTEMRTEYFDLNFEIIEREL